MLLSLYSLVALAVAVTGVGASLSDGHATAAQSLHPRWDSTLQHSTTLGPSLAWDDHALAPCVASEHAQHNCSTLAVSVALEHVQQPQLGSTSPARCVAVGHAQLLPSLLPLLSWCPQPEARREPLLELSSTASCSCIADAHAHLQQPLSVPPFRELSTAPQVVQPPAPSTSWSHTDRFARSPAFSIDSVVAILFAAVLLSLSPRLGLVVRVAAYLSCASATSTASILSIDTTKLRHIDTNRAAQLGCLILCRLPAVFILTRSQPLVGSLSPLFARLQELYTIFTTREPEMGVSGGIVIGVALDVPLLAMDRPSSEPDSHMIQVTVRLPLDAEGQELGDVVIGGAYSCETKLALDQLPRPTRYLVSLLIDEPDHSRQLHQSVSGVDISAIHAKIVVEQNRASAPSPDDHRFSIPSAQENADQVHLPDPFSLCTPPSSESITAEPSASCSCHDRGGETVALKPWRSDT